jgi:hypothetical protein
MAKQSLLLLVFVKDCWRTSTRNGLAIYSFKVLLSQNYLPNFHLFAEPCIFQTYQNRDFQAQLILLLVLCKFI